MIIVDAILRAISLFVISFICLSVLWRAFRVKDKSPTDGLVYGQRTKKTWLFKLKKKMRDVI